MNNKNVAIGLLIFGIAFLALVLFLNKPAHSTGAVYVDRSGQTIVWENTILTMNQAAQKRVCVYVGYGNVNLTLPDNPYDGFSLQVMKYGGTNTLAVYPNGTAAIVDASGTYVYNTSDATTTYPTITLMYNAALNLWVKAGQTDDWIVAGDRSIVFKSNVQWITSVTGDLVLSTLQASGIINVDTTSDDIDLTLPTSVYNGFETTISKTGENTLAILAAGTDRIQDASATYVYNNEDTSGNSVSITFKYDSSNGRWMIKNQIGSWVIVNEWDVDIRPYSSGVNASTYNDGSQDYLLFNNSLISVRASDSFNGAAELLFYRSRGTNINKEAVQVGDYIHSMIFGGWDGSNWISYGGITTQVTDSSGGKIQFWTLPPEGATTNNMILEDTGELKTRSIYPLTDDTYYLGKNDDDTPYAFKGVILKDTTNGKYYRIEITNGSVVATDLTD